MLLPDDVQNRLIEEASFGNVDAFEQLQEAYSKTIKGYIYSRIDSNKAAVDDINQEVWIEVWQSIHKYNSTRGRFYTFLHLIADNKINLYFKQNAKNRVISEMAVPSTFSKEFLNKLLHITFEYGGYPHQLIAFGYSKLIYTAERPNGTKGDAKRTAELFKELLVDLNVKMRDDYLDISKQLESEINKAFLPLVKKLALTLSQLINQKTDHSTWKLVEERGLLETEAARTRLCDYSASGDYERDVSLWSYSVLKRVRRVAIPRLTSNIRIYE